METVNFKKIMIATDGSDCSRLAAEKGIELARLSGGTVYAVSVVSTASLSIDGDNFSSIGMNPNLELIYEELKNQGQQAVDYIKGLGEMKGIKVESVLLEGNPPEELLRYAEEEKIDIVIMGTLGKTGLHRLLLGSVAENLVRHSKVPIMIVRKKCKP
ncbi:MAG: universal stress protein [Bacteroidota bacterium]|nr:universal stress protein [Bacteroidota bacterium]